MIKPTRNVMGMENSIHVKEEVANKILVSKPESEKTLRRFWDR
jgi:hypothetical protein